VNRAGKSTRQMARRRRESAACFALMGIVGFVVVILFLKNAKAAGIGGIGVLVLLFLLQALPGIINKGVDRRLKEEKRAIRGAQAEEKIGDLLAGSSTDYYVLHDVKSPYGNIDHIVISKNSGVFLLETKAHGGKVEVKGETLLVNGKNPEKDFIVQTLKNTYWLRDEIAQIVGAKPWINSIIVFTNAFVPQTKPVKGVRIINKKYLLNALHELSRPNTVTRKSGSRGRKLAVS
jgi:Nuclease-related domain